MNNSKAFRLLKIITKGWTAQDKRYEALTELMEGLENGSTTPTPVQPPTATETVFRYRPGPGQSQGAKVQVNDRRFHRGTVGNGWCTVVDFTTQGNVVIQFDNQAWPTVVMPSTLDMETHKETVSV